MHDLYILLIYIHTTYPKKQIYIYIYILYVVSENIANSWPVILGQTLLKEQGINKKIETEGSWQMLSILTPMGKIFCQIVVGLLFSFPFILPAMPSTSSQFRMD